MSGLLFKLEKENGGFFCQIWQLACFHILSKKQNIDLYIDDSEWLFKNKDGWLDYFYESSLKNIKYNLEKEKTLFRYVNDTIRHSFTLNEYKTSLNEILKPNNIIQDRIQNTMLKYKLIENNFASIFIRRGDKLYCESKLIFSEKYIDVIKNMNTTINKIFLQTDDYTCYTEIKNNEYIIQNNIEVITTCPEDKLGAYVFNYQITNCLNKDTNANTYIKNISKISSQKCVKEYNSNEIKEHIEEMLCGLFICLKGNYLITDYQSNTSRFLALMFNKDNNISVLNEDTIPEMDKPVMCPAHGFILT